ncbi:SWR1-complex protein 5 [Pleurotus pulmonarius]|nr:hypothetical protein EYR36_003020 [Pleurotus pulmonarius]
MSYPHTGEFDSDSENDGDYVPPIEKDASSSGEDGEHEDKSTPHLIPTAEDEEAKKAAKEALWASFQASVASEPPAQAQTAVKVKIEKRYRFAGEDVIEVVEVDEDSEDAKKWPRAGETSSTSASASTSSTPKPPAKRPGPRKSKVTLAPLRAKKLSTLEKSAMDWRAHVAAEASSGLQEELDANRKGGGYLEKVDSLKRVDERKDDILEASRSSKRLRT